MANPGEVKVYGMPASANAAGPTMLAMESGAGGPEMCNLMTGEHMKPEFLAINPYHQIPSLVDGDLKIGESNAILRYLARAYSPKVYPADDLKECARIDFAMDTFSHVYKGHMKTVYITLGFASAAEGVDQAAENKAYVEQADMWLTNHVGSKTFVGGSTLCDSGPF